MLLVVCKLFVVRCVKSLSVVCCAVFDVCCLFLVLCCACCCVECVVGCRWSLFVDGGDLFFVVCCSVLWSVCCALL